MLDIIRNLVSSIFGKILLAIMVLSFALWGVGDILSSGNSQLAAKVGNEKISLDEFYIKFQQTVRDYNQNTNSNLSLKEAYELKLHNLLLQDLIYSRMVNDYAKKRGIYLNEESLKSVISNLDEFKDSNEIFSSIKYKNFILNNFQSEDAFLSEIENSIFQGIIFESFNADNYINDAIINKLYDYEGEKRTISYFLLNKNEVKIDTNNKMITIPKKFVLFQSTHPIGSLLILKANTTSIGIKNAKISLKINKLYPFIGKSFKRLIAQPP